MRLPRLAAVAIQHGVRCRYPGALAGPGDGHEHVERFPDVPGASSFDWPSRARDLPPSVARHRCAVGCRLTFELRLVFNANFEAAAHPCSQLGSLRLPCFLSGAKAWLQPSPLQCEPQKLSNSSTLG